MSYEPATALLTAHCSLSYYYFISFVVYPYHIHAGCGYAVVAMVVAVGRLACMAATHNVVYCHTVAFGVKHLYTAVACCYLHCRHWVFFHSVAVLGIAVATPIGVGHIGFRSSAGDYCFEYTIGNLGIVADNFAVSNAGSEIRLQSESNVPNSPLNVTIRDFKIESITEILKKDSLLTKGN